MQNDQVEVSVVQDVAMTSDEASDGIDVAVPVAASDTSDTGSVTARVSSPAT